MNLPEKTFEFTAETVYRGGVWPRQITDLKGIQGDTSDNIPGVRGVASAHRFCWENTALWNIFMR